MELDGGLAEADTRGWTNAFTVCDSCVLSEAQGRMLVALCKDSEANEHLGGNKGLAVNGG